MKSKYKKSIGRSYLFNRWKMKYPPDDWCILGISIRWIDPSYYQYRVCFFGFELRIGINREFIKS